ncbi:phage tail protein [Nocardioides abyssi]|uniref:Tail fiber protein n=1 Tax=Nocardioides abyssi TaxID=3058370 RepID=A0ABT8EYQ9_9ACTN|nr:tail fiber protein [Nocardioides abyssi]MDN4163327.1 tail fiber protein [Nocardioides abyssi]
MDSEPMTGEIGVCAFSFPPKNWAVCDGSLVAIAQNSALFALLGTTYGGNGQTNFALPDLRGSAPVAAGSGPGLSPYALGGASGAATVTLTGPQVPAHHHPVAAAATPATSADPQGRVLATQEQQAYRLVAPDRALRPAALGTTGGSQPHENRQPYLAMTFVICLYGVFPQHP